MHEKIIFYYENDEIATSSDALIETTIETTTETTTEEQLDLEYITTEGQIVDTNLYLSTAVSGASNNDIFSMLLSIRNILLLFFIIFLVLKVKNMIHSVLSKIFENKK